MAWSIFTQGGGPGAALAWADDFLTAAGLPDDPPDEQFVYDWERSEGGGGANNPLNQGPDPNNPALSGGSQYGGGASDYASIPAGIQGAVDYLNMPDYADVKAALADSDYAAAAKALWDSPWAGGHYGYGSAWSTDPVPGQPSTITAAPTAGPTDTAPAGTGGATATLTGWGPGGVLPGSNPLSPKTYKNIGAYVALVATGMGLCVMGAWKIANPNQSLRASLSSTAGQAAAAAPLLAA